MAYGKGDKRRRSLHKGASFSKHESSVRRRCSVLCDDMVPEMGRRHNTGSRAGYHSRRWFSCYRDCYDHEVGRGYRKHTTAWWPEHWRHEDRKD